MPTNATRNANARRTIRAHVGRKPNGAIYREDFVDTLADILHAANAEGIDTQQLIQSARMHFDAETTGKDGPTMDSALAIQRIGEIAKSYNHIRTIYPDNWTWGYILDHIADVCDGTIKPEKEG